MSGGRGKDAPVFLGGGHAGKSRKLRIDFHVHLAVYAYHKPWVTEWMNRMYPTGYDDFIHRYSDPGSSRNCYPEGVDYACILAELSYVTTGVCTNKQVREFCAGQKAADSLLRSQSQPLYRSGGELRRKVETEGFRGIKLYPTYQHYYLNDPRMYPLYRAAEDLGFRCLSIPVPRCSKAPASSTATRSIWTTWPPIFPRLKLVMAHSGRGFWYDRAFFLSKLHRQSLHGDIPGYRRQS